MWDKRDWHQFFEIAQRRWQRHRPPRPVAPSGVNRLHPAAGFSLSELDDAGINLEIAERLDPANVEFHMGLAGAYSKAGRHEDARRERRTSIAIAKESESRDPG